MVTFRASESNRHLNPQKYYFDIETNKIQLQNYLPPVIDLLQGMQTKIIASKENPSVDGLMLLLDVSDIDLSY
ncbi:hypothetical protein N824_15060 [Pedobacter sp. V48]|nr:hypothetical protein N824_15060 [Pedobacter sp. V48]